MKHNIWILLINLICVLLIALFLLSIIIDYNGRERVAFWAFIMLILLNLLKYMKKEKTEPRKLKLKLGKLESGKQDYTRLLLPNPINDYPQKIKRINRIIKIPQICPICGSKEVLKKSKLKIRFYYKKSYRRFRPYERERESSHLRIFLCKKHTKERKKYNILAYCISFFLPILLVILLLLILLLFYIIFVLILIGTGIGSIYIGLKNLKMSNLIRNHIFHEYYPEIGAVIAVKNQDWIEEFRGHNKCLHIQGPIVDYLRNSEYLKHRYAIYFVSASVFMVTTVLLSAFLSVLIYSRFFILVYLGSFVFGGITIYLYWFVYYSLGVKRLEEYSNFLWKSGFQF